MFRKFCFIIMFLIPLLASPLYAERMRAEKASTASSGGTASFSSTIPQGVLYISQGNTAASSPLIVTNGSQLTIGAGTTQTQAALFIRGSGTGTGFALRIADTTPTDRVVVLDNGNVGIGVTNPAQKLEVSGTSIAVSSNTVNFADVTDGWVLTFDTGTNTWAGEAAGAGSGDITSVGSGATGDVFANGDSDSLLGSRIGIGVTSAVAYLNIQSTTGSTFILKVADSGPNDRLVVQQDGNFGIGTTAPTQLLDVSGTANATTITEGGNAVFNSTEVPGGELGGTWASPTVDATHSGSAHHSAVTMSGVPDYITLSGQDIVRAKLDISDDTNATGGTGIGITANDLTFVATELSALTWSAGGSAQFSWDWNLSAGDPKINFNNNSINIETGNLGIGLTNPVALLQVGTSPTPGLVVTAAGRTGIGNTAPIALLQVGTSPNVGLMVISSGNVGIGTSLPIGLLQVGTSPGTAGLTVTGGNVGVGTTSPTAKLEIIPANTNTGFYLNIAGSKLIMKSPDGTCSACGANNSDVWACASVTCP